jgi:hypothetical protein
VHGKETMKILDDFISKHDALIADAKEKFKFEEGSVTHPSQLERTLLLEGKVTCTTISIGNLTDNTVNPNHLACLFPSLNSSLHVIYLS